MKVETGHFRLVRVRDPGMWKVNSECLMASALGRFSSFLPHNLDELNFSYLMMALN